MLGHSSLIFSIYSSRERFPELGHTCTDSYYMNLAVNNFSLTPSSAPLTSTDTEAWYCSDD